MAELTTQQTRAQDQFGLNQDLAHFLIEAIDKRDAGRALNLTQKMHAADLAEFINQVSTEHREALVDLIKESLEPEVLVNLETAVRDAVITQLGAERSAEAIRQLESDDAVYVIEDLEKKDQQEILENIPDAEYRADIREGLSYAEDSAGRLMSRHFVSLQLHWDVGQTIDFLRNEDNDLPDDFYQMFVLDKKGVPIGTVLLSRVLCSKRPTLIKDIMEGDVKAIPITTDQEEAAYLFNKYNLVSAPVVNNKGVMVGEISMDDIAHVIEEEAEEDIMRLSGVTSTDIFEGAMSTTARRFPWLFINLLTAIAASAVIVKFEGSIESIVALAVLMPIIASMAGNAGTQALAVAVRAIATRELTHTNAHRVLSKELLAGLANGMLFAFVAFVITFLFYRDLSLASIFALAMLLALAIAGLSGALVPLIMARIGVDPAVASTVFLTTITDVSAFFIFLGLATWWLF